MPSVARLRVRSRSRADSPPRGGRGRGAGPRTSQQTGTATRQQLTLPQAHNGTSAHAHHPTPLHSSEIDTCVGSLPRPYLLQNGRCPQILHGFFFPPPLRAFHTLCVCLAARRAGRSCRHSQSLDAGRVRTSLPERLRSPGILSLQLGALDGVTLCAALRVAWDSGLKHELPHRPGAKEYVRPNGGRPDRVRSAARWAADSSC